MPLQNRVNPFGEIFRTPARGTLMGNRGILHRNKEIVHSFVGRRWITCLLEFNGRQRELMTEGRYTELFFLDEATALAAGHRPCAECQRDRYRAFRDAWRGWKGEKASSRVEEMDREIHFARVARRREKVSYTAPLASLPSGCFVDVDGRAHLLWGGALQVWAPEGYTSAVKLPGDALMTVLTPAPIVGCLRQGYEPGIHATARLAG